MLSANQLMLSALLIIKIREYLFPAHNSAFSTCRVEKESAGLAPVEPTGGFGHRIK